MLDYDSVGVDRFQSKPKPFLNMENGQMSMKIQLLAVILGFDLGADIFSQFKPVSKWTNPLCSHVSME